MMRYTCSVCGAKLIESEKVSGVCYLCDVKVDQILARGVKDWTDISTHEMRVIVDRVKRRLDSSLDVIETLVLYHDNDPLVYATLNLDTIGAVNVTIRSDTLLTIANTLA